MLPILPSAGRRVRLIEYLRAHPDGASKSDILRDVYAGERGAQDCLYRDVMLVRGERKSRETVVSLYGFGYILVDYVVSGSARDRILAELESAKGEIVSLRRLAEVGRVAPATVMTHICALRREAMPDRVVVCHRGQGYKLVKVRS